MDKFELPEKLFGVFDHALDPERQRVGLLAGFTDRFPMPVSRYTGNREEDIAAAPNLSVLARSPESGVALVLEITRLPTDSHMGWKDSDKMCCINKRCRIKCKGA